MLDLIRKGNEVFFDGKKLTIVAQATKGPGKEVVKIEGLEGSNGQKWIALSKLKEGENQIECQGREVSSSSSQPYELTEEEKEEIKALKSRIDEIINQAKARYVAKPKILTTDQVNALPETERLAYIDSLEKYVLAVKNGQIQ